MGRLAGTAQVYLPVLGTLAGAHHTTSQPCARIRASTARAVVRGGLP